jgi:hypothetical protein
MKSVILSEVEIWKPHGYLFGRPFDFVQGKKKYFFNRLLSITLHV